MNKARMLVFMTVVAGLALAAQGQESDAKKQQAKRDKLRIAVQRICPISGKKLGEHGVPVKVTVGEDKEEIFLCCQDCLKGQIDPKHWATIHANFAKAQRICPVMEHELPKNPKWTIVKGQVFFVCCPPCTKKIADQPETFLRKLDQLYAASLQAERTRR